MKIHLSEENLRKLQNAELKILIEFDRVCKELDLNYSLSGGTLIGAVRHKGFIPWDDDIDLAMPRQDYEIFLKEGQGLLPDNLFIQTYETDDSYVHNFAKIINSSTKLVQKTVRNLIVESGIYIDVFPIDAMSNNTLIRGIDNFLIKQIYKTKHLQDVQWVKDTPNPIRKFFKFIMHKACVWIGPKTLNRWETSIRIKNNKEKNKLTYGDYYSFPLYGFENMKIMPIGIFEETEGIVFEELEFLAVKDWHTYLEATYGDYMTLPPEEERLPKHYTIELVFDD